MDDVTTVEDELRRVEHRGAVIAYVTARDALAGACAAFVRAADRAREARETLWEETWSLLARGGSHGPMPALLAQTEEGRAVLDAARARLRSLL